MTAPEEPEPDRVGDAPRPRETLSLYGQQEAEREFLTAYRGGRLHHAWLITGQRGIGKATLAWRIARFLIARNGPPEAGIAGLEGAADLSVPEDHPVVRRTALLAEPAVKLLRRPHDSKSGKLAKDITIGEVRALKTSLSLSSPDGAPRIAIIDAADDMNASAANAILKILEEPPENAYFFLVSSAPSGLLPTIRSRCRFLRCKPLSGDDLTGALAAAGIGGEDGAARLRELCSGSIGEAVRLANEDGAELYGAIVDMASGAPGMERSKAVALASGCEGPSAAGRYDATTRLFALLSFRLAVRAASGVTPPAAADGEPELLERLAGSPGRAEAWADLHDRFKRRAAEAKLVTLDPFLVVLDFIREFDRTAAKAAL